MNVLIAIVLLLLFFRFIGFIAKTVCAVIVIGLVSYILICVLGGLAA